MQMYVPVKQTAGYSGIFCIILNLTITSPALPAIVPILTVEED